MSSKNSKNGWDMSERVIFKVFGAEIKLSRWNNAAKLLTGISAATALISCLLTILAKITIPGLMPISSGIFFWCFAIKQFNDYLDTKNKTLLYIGLFMGVVFIINLYVGIMQIVGVMG